MLRGLVLALLLANLFFFCWARGWLDGVAGISSQSDREPERLARQVRADAVTLLPPPSISPPQAAPRASDAVSDAASAALPNPALVRLPSAAATAAFAGAAGVAGLAATSVGSAAAAASADLSVRRPGTAAETTATALANTPTNAPPNAAANAATKTAAKTAGPVGATNARAKANMAKPAKSASAASR
jgi:hypothetical protein